MPSYHVYQSRTLYIGMTSDLVRRMEEHRSGAVSGFTSQYNVTRLVYYETTEDVQAATARERQLKGWRRSKKLGLIDGVNPGWRDLGRDLLTG
jgi:putative endonuclease